MFPAAKGFSIWSGQTRHSIEQESHYDENCIISIVNEFPGIVYRVRIVISLLEMYSSTCFSWASLFCEAAWSQRLIIEILKI
jgi:hypothetical protein